jgi:molecular chaperone DnaK (HSP70)
MCDTWLPIPRRGGVCWCEGEYPSLTGTLTDTGSEATYFLDATLRFGAMHGISVGATASVAVDSTGEILRNELGGHTTASFFAFTADGRAIGEAAVSSYTANAKTTATQVGRLALLPYEALTTGDGERFARHWQWSHAVGSDGSLVMKDVAAPGGERDVSAVSMLGALLGQMRTTNGTAAGSPLSVALPPCASGPDAAVRARAMLADAAAIGGWNLVAAPSAAEALGASLARKWPFAKADEGGAPVDVLVLDIGASSTIAAIVRLTPPTGGELAMEAQATILEERTDPFLGARLFDEALFDHFAAGIAERCAR